MTEGVTQGARRGDAADAVPWTREQIEAWVNCEHSPRDLRSGPRGTGSLLSPGALGRRKRGRRLLVRLAPECADYNALVDQMYDLGPGRVHWELIEEEEVGPRITAALAALWARSLSEPVEGDAPMTVTNEDAGGAPRRCDPADGGG